MSHGDEIKSTPAGPAGEAPPQDLESHVASLLRRRAARNLNEVQAQAPRSVGQRMSDAVARGVGSWRFIPIFLIVLVIRMVVNVVAACGIGT